MKIKSLLILAIAVLVMASCSEDDEVVINRSLVNLVVKMPSSIDNGTAELDGIAMFTFENVNTGEKLVREVGYIPQTFFDVEDGLYNVEVRGKIRYEVEAVNGEILVRKDEVRAMKKNVEVVGGNFSLSLEFFIPVKGKGLVLSEIFFASTQTPEGKQYSGGDQFFEIYNNSDKVMYADGLCIAETELLTVRELNEYTPNILKDAVPVSSVYMIPGKGKDYPIQPGQAIVISDIAINHKEKNANSFDLSKSDFEWFDGKDIDVDVPEVPNLIKMVSTSKSVWYLHNRGFTSYVLCKFEDVMTPEKFTTDYAYHYKYHFVYGDFQKWMDFDAWKIPNKYIIDAVECSAPSSFEWLVMDPRLDISYTHCGDGDASRYGKSVRRKVIAEENGRKILQDTNDSAKDFIPDATPSPGVIEAFKK